MVEDGIRLDVLRTAARRIQKVRVRHLPPTKPEAQQLPARNRKSRARHPIGWDHRPALCSLDETWEPNSSGETYALPGDTMVEDGIRLDVLRTVGWRIQKVRVRRLPSTKPEAQ